MDLLTLAQMAVATRWQPLTLPKTYATMTFDWERYGHRWFVLPLLVGSAGHLSDWSKDTAWLDRLLAAGVR